MASLNLTYDILARDQASATFRKVGNEAERAGSRVDGALGSGLKRSLAAGAGAIAGIGLVSAFKATVGAASEAEQSVGGVQAVFKGFAQSVISDSKGADRALGLSGNAYRELATVIGSQLKNAAVPMRELQGRTEDIIQIGADLAAQFGGSTQEAVNALSSAFRGELDPIERYGVSLNAAAVGAKAVELGLSDSETELSQNAKTMATLAIITEQSADAQGAFGRESDTAAGRAARAAAQWENLQASLGEKLLPAFSGLMDILGTAVIPALGEVVDGVAALVGAIDDIPGPVKVAVGVFGAIVLLKGPVSSAFETIALKALYARDSIVNAGTGVGRFKSAASGLVGFLGGPWGIAIGAAVTGISLLASGNDDAAEAEAGHKTAAQDLASALRDTNGEITENIRLERIREAQQEGLIDVAERAGVSQEDIAGAIDGNSDALARLVTGLRDYGAAQTTVAQDAEGYVTSTITAQGQAALDAAGEWQGFSGQVDAARAALDQQQGVLGASTTATAGLGEAADDAAGDVQSLKDELDKLTGASVSSMEAEISLREAIARAAGALEDMNGTVLNGRGNLNLQSEAGRAAAEVLLDVRDSGNELISTMQDQGATFEEVRQRDRELRNSFINTAKQMGISQADAEELADDILGIPSERNTRITAPTKEAVEAVEFLQTTINNLKGRTVTVTAEFAQSFGSVRNVLFGTGDGPGMSGTGDGPGARMPAMPRVAVHRQTGDGLGLPVSARFDVGQAISEMTEWAKSQATPQLSAGIGWSAMWNTVRRAFGSGVNLHSAYRPGSITATGNLSYHASGRAIDITPSMNIFEWIKANYPGSRELIFSPAGGRQIWNGQEHYYSEPTRSDHFDHIHWAMKNGGVINEPVIGRGLRSGGSYMFGEAGPETVTPGLPNSGPIALDDATIIKLARVMRDGAENVTADALALVGSRGRNNG